MENLRVSVHTHVMIQTLKTIGDRIRYARTAYRTDRGLEVMRQRVIADALGISIPSVSEWERNQAKPSREKMRPIADVLGVNVLWLEFGLGLPERNSNNKVAPANISETGGVPMVDAYAAAADLDGAIAASMGRVPTYFPTSANSFAVPLWDNSNATAFSEGDRVAFDPDKSPEPGDMVLARAPDGRPVFGELWVVRDGSSVTYRVHHLNPAYGDETLDCRASIIAVMTEHARPARR